MGASQFRVWGVESPGSPAILRNKRSQQEEEVSASGAAEESLEDSIWERLCQGDQQLLIPLLFHHADCTLEELLHDSQVAQV